MNSKHIGPAFPGTSVPYLTSVSPMSTQQNNATDEKINEASRKLEVENAEQAVKRQKTTDGRMSGSEAKVQQLGQGVISVTPPGLGLEEAKKRRLLSYITFRISQPQTQEVLEISILKNVLMTYSKFYKKLLSEDNWKENQTNTIEWRDYSYLALKYVCEFMEYKSKILIKDEYQSLEKMPNLLIVFNDIYAISNHYDIKELKKECEKIIPIYFKKGLQEIADSFYMCYNYPFSSDLEEIWLNTYLEALNTSPHPEELYELIITLANTDFSGLNPSRALTIHTYLLKCIQHILSHDSFSKCTNPELVQQLYCALFDLTYMNTPYIDLQLSNFIAHPLKNKSFNLKTLINHPHFQNAYKYPKIQLLHIYIICYLGESNLDSLVNQAKLINNENLKQIALGLVHKYYEQFDEAYQYFLAAKSHMENEKLALDVDCLMFEIDLKRKTNSDKIAEKLSTLEKTHPLIAHYLWQQKGMSEQDAKDYKAARDSFIKAFKLNASLKCLKSQVSCYFQLKEYASVVEFCENYQNLRKQDPLAIVFQGCSYIYLNKCEKGISCLDEALKLNLDPETRLTVLQSKVKAYKTLHNYSEAITICFEILKIDKNNIKTYFDLADCYFKSQQFVAAIKIYEKCESLKPNGSHPQILFNIGLCYMQLNQYNMAIEKLEKSLTMQHSYETLFYTGLCYIENEDKAALIVFQSLIKNQQFSVDKLNTAINFCAKRQKHQIAQQLFNEFLSNSSNASDIQKVNESMKSYFEKNNKS